MRQDLRPCNKSRPITSGTHAFGRAFYHVDRRTDGQSDRQTVGIIFIPYLVPLSGTSPPFLCHSTPRGTVFTDRSPEFAFIACHGSHASLIRTHLSCVFSVSFTLSTLPSLPLCRRCSRGTRDKGSGIFINEGPKGRSADINLTAREKKGRERKGESGREGEEEEDDTALP